MTDRPEPLFLVALLRAALRDEPPPTPPADLDFDRLFSLAQFHKVDALVFRPVLDLHACPPKLLSRWKAFSDQALRTELLFDAERERLFHLFDLNGIDYLPLKGILIKELYPHKGMRQFADNDVLIRKTSRRALRKLMLQDGYRTEKHSDYSAHDVYLKPPVFNFEMHHALFNRSEIVPYFKQIWTRAIKVGVHEYRMSNEDFYLYHIAHFHKHFHNGGAGFRFFCDLYLLLRDLPLDRPAVDRALSEIGLTDFENKARLLSEAWFGDSPAPVDRETFRFVLSSGAYGTLRHSVESQVSDGSGLLRYIFLPFQEMKARFPFLKYLPFLLPFCWIYRFFRAFFSRKKLKRALLVAKFKRKQP